MLHEVEQESSVRQKTIIYFDSEIALPVLFPHVFLLAFFPGWNILHVYELSSPAPTQSNSQSFHGNCSFARIVSAELRRRMLAILPRTKKSAPGAILEKLWEEKTINLHDLLQPQEKILFSLFEFFKEKKSFLTERTAKLSFLVEVFYCFSFHFLSLDSAASCATADAK